ncbi:MAG TPA: response regulator [Candidatus Obscuribacterales bacterium]|jgi:twitching motility two-component system response regulator PilH
MSTILVVDDSGMLRHMVSDLLKKHGLNVIVACDGLEAKEKIEAKTPDLVITDLIMPKMNGYELCRWLKCNPKYQLLPVIICSTKNEEFDRYWGMKQGADAYISKPFHPSEMMEAVKKLLPR